jgi:hypothetical protein
MVSILHTFLVDADARARNPEMKLWSLFDKIHARLIKQVQLGGKSPVSQAYNFVMGLPKNKVLQLLYSNFKNEKGVMALKQQGGIVIEGYKDFISGNWDNVQIQSSNSSKFTHQQKK